jgi:catechol-2,3-dioxygenase
VATITGFNHIGMVADDPARLAEFYRDILGMTITGSSGTDGAHGATAFLSSRPAEEDHELAIFSHDRYRHVAFKVASGSDLRALYSELVERGIAIKLTLVHPSSLALYFDDPEGNMIEIYWPTDLGKGRSHDDWLDLVEAELITSRSAP